jgi:hypothetical protein
MEKRSLNFGITHSDRKKVYPGAEPAGQDPAGQVVQHQTDNIPAGPNGLGEPGPQTRLGKGPESSVQFCRGAVMFSLGFLSWL